ncbi:MAG: DUF1427 family protein [Pseudomonadota bacterium]
MSWIPYAVSLGVGLGVGVLYGLIAVRSPAPPIIALLGLLGMLAGESLVAYWRAHGELGAAKAAVAKCLHTKSFKVAEADPRPAADAERS